MYKKQPAATDYTSPGTEGAVALLRYIKSQPDQQANVTAVEIGYCISPEAACEKPLERDFTEGYYHGEFLRSPYGWDILFDWDVFRNEWHREMIDQRRGSKGGIYAIYALRGFHIRPEVHRWELYVLGRAQELIQGGEVGQATLIIRHFQSWLENTYCEWEWSDVWSATYEVLHTAHKKAGELLEPPPPCGWK